MHPYLMEILQSEEELQLLGKYLTAELAAVGKQRREIIVNIVEDINKVHPQARVHIFGSVFTGLATFNSTFDIYIDFGMQILLGTRL